MKLTDLFDRIAIINLPDRTDRQRQIAAELRRLNLDLSTPGVQLFPAIKPDHAADFPSRGARGAYLSHLKVLQQARRDGVQSILVMEDDLLIDKRLQPALGRLAIDLQQEDWSFLYVGHLGKARLGPVRLEETRQPQQCLHCYAVHRRAYDPLIAYLESCLARPAGHPAGGAMHVDGAVTMFRQFNPQHRTLLVQPSMGAQRPSRSDITHNRWYDRMPVVRQCLGVARSLKARWQQMLPQRTGEAVF